MERILHSSNSVSSLNSLKGSLNSLNLLNKTVSTTMSKTSSQRDLNKDIADKGSVSNSSTMLQLQVLQNSPQENLLPSTLNKKKRDAPVMRYKILLMYLDLKHLNHISQGSQILSLKTNR